LHLKTSGPFGWLAMRSLAALRFWRPRTVRFRREQDMIERWLQSVTVAAAADYALACSTADLAVWARGYGDVRHRGLARLAQFFTDWPRRIAADKEALGDAVRASLAAAYSDPDAEVTP
jgi:indolepyruvate ferredoxin oxidoreductase beta subunit